MWTFGHKGKWRLVDGEATFRALRDYHKLIIGCDKKKCVSIGTKGEYKVYFSTEDILNSKIFGEKIYKNSDVINEYKMRSLELIDEMGEYSNYIMRKINNNLEADELIGIFEANYNLRVKSLAHYQFTNKEFSEKSVENIVELLDNNSFDKNDIINSLMASDTTSLDTYKEMCNWIKILKHFILENIETNKLEDLIIGHASKFGHLGVSYNVPLGFSVNTYIEKLQKSSFEELQRLESIAKEIEMKAKYSEDIAESCARKIGLSQDSYETIRNISELSVIRLKMAEVARLNGRARESLMRIIFSKIEEKTGRRMDDYFTKFLTFDEINEALLSNKLPSYHNLIERYNHNMMTLNDGKISLVAGKKSEYLANSLIRLNNNEPQKRYRGTPISGSVNFIGKSIVIKAGEINEISLVGSQIAGKIVVVPMIKPNIITACASASAIITEEGGYTSHAAVIARELGVPCIIGVDGITESINSGQYLEFNSLIGQIKVVEDYKLKANKLNNRRKNKIKINSITHYDENQSIQMKSKVFICNLEQKEVNDSMLVGNKARNIHLLGSYSPPGFVITRHAIKIIKDQYNLAKDIHSFIQERVPKLPFFSEVNKQIEELNTGKLAIRSSFLIEDSIQASHAGLFKTKLNVNPNNQNELWSAIIEVALSENNEQVNVYQKILGINEYNSSMSNMSIIVQSMVASTVSGVCITNYKKNNHNWVLVEYKIGQLDSLVKGSYTPMRTTMRREHFLDSKNKDNTLNYIFPTEIEYYVGKCKVRRLFNIFMEIEKIFNCPVEIEWCIDGNGKICILQARSIANG